MQHLLRFFPHAYTGDSCLGKLSVGVENVVVCPATCSVANASVLWCLSPPDVCLESEHGEEVYYADISFYVYVDETDNLIVSRIPSNENINTTCTYQLESGPICEPVSFEMTQRIGR